MNEIIKINQLSYTELLIEVHEVCECMLRLRESDMRITSNIITTFIPYLSFICDSLDDFHIGTNKIHSSWFKNIEGKSLQEIIKENRSTIKLYSENKKNKVVQKLEDDTSLFFNLLIDDYNSSQKLFINTFGQYDLGVYSFRNIDYANTYLLFKNSKALYTINGDLNGLMMREFSSVLCNYIFQANIYPIRKGPVKIFSNPENFTHQDLYFRDSGRFNAFINKEDKYWRLFLYNYYCQINYVRIILPIVMGVRQNFYYRIKFCTYLLSIKGLDLLSKKLPKIKHEYPNINELIITRENLVPKESILRNNLFHYNIEGIPYENFDQHENLFKQMIEYSIGMPFEDFDTQIDLELDRYQKAIKEILF